MDSSYIWLIFAILFALTAFLFILYFGNKHKERNKKEEKKIQQNNEENFNKRLIIIRGELLTIVRDVRVAFFKWNEIVIDRPSIQTIHNMWRVRLSAILDNEEYKLFQDVTSEFSKFFKGVRMLNTIKPNLLFERPQDYKEVIELLELEFLYI